MGNSFYYWAKIKNMDGYIFRKKKLGWTSGFRAVGDLPRVH